MTIFRLAYKEFILAFLCCICKLYQFFLPHRKKKEMQKRGNKELHLGKCPGGYDYLLLTILIGLAMIVSVLAWDSYTGLKTTFSSCLLGRINNAGIPIQLYSSDRQITRNVLEKIRQMGKGSIAQVPGLKIFPYEEIEGGFDSMYAKIPTDTWKKDKKELNTGWALFKSDPLWQDIIKSRQQNPVKKLKPEIIINESIFNEAFIYEEYRAKMLKLLPKIFHKDLPEEYIEFKKCSIIWLTVSIQDRKEDPSKKDMLVRFDAHWVKTIPALQRLAFLYPLDLYDLLEMTRVWSNFVFFPESKGAATLRVKSLCISKDNELTDQQIWHFIRQIEGHPLWKNSIRIMLADPMPLKELQNIKLLANDNKSEYVIPKSWITDLEFDFNSLVKSFSIPNKIARKKSNEQKIQKFITATSGTPVWDEMTVVTLSTALEEKWIQFFAKDYNIPIKNIFGQNKSTSQTIRYTPDGLLLLPEKIVSKEGNSHSNKLRELRATSVLISDRQGNKKKLQDFTQCIGGKQDLHKKNHFHLPDVPVITKVNKCAKQYNIESELSVTKVFGIYPGKRATTIAYIPDPLLLNKAAKKLTSFHNQKNEQLLNISFLYQDALNRFNFLLNTLKDLSLPYALCCFAFVVGVLWTQLSTIVGHRKKRYAIFLSKGMSWLQIYSIVCIQIVMSSVIGGILVLFVSCLPYKLINNQFSFTINNSGLRISDAGSHQLVTFYFSHFLLIWIGIVILSCIIALFVLWANVNQKAPADML